MRTQILPVIDTAEAWRSQARTLLVNNIAPNMVSWRCGGDSPTLFEAVPVDEDLKTTATAASNIKVPRRFIELTNAVAWHSDPGRFDLLYHLLWRLQQTKGLLMAGADPQVAKAQSFEKAVHRDCHKMTAFVRFKEVPTPSERRRFIAWFEPTHFSLERTAPFFARRFGDMDWSIVTPYMAAGCLEGRVRLLPGPHAYFAQDDATEDLWKTYYASIFNPARLKVSAMQSEMPKKYWKNLPEADLIPELIASAEQRLNDMREARPQPISTRAARTKARHAERARRGNRS